MLPFFACDLALGDVVRPDAGTGHVIQSVKRTWSAMAQWRNIRGRTLAHSTIWAA